MNVYHHISTEIEVVNREVKFAVLYITNESTTDAYFDDLEVKHNRLVWQEKVRCGTVLPFWVSD